MIKKSVEITNDQQEFLEENPEINFSAFVRNKLQERKTKSETMESNKPIEQQIRAKLVLHLEDGSKYDRQKLEQYIAKELGIKQETVKEVIDQDVKEGDIYEPKDGRIKMT